MYVKSDGQVNPVIKGDGLEQVPGKGGSSFNMLKEVSLVDMGIAILVGVVEWI